MKILQTGLFLLIVPLIITYPTLVPGIQSGGGNVFHTHVPDFSGNIILGRPTHHSITLSLLLNHDATCRISYGIQGKPDIQETPPANLIAGVPVKIILTNLESATAYHYRILDASTGAPLLPEKGEGRFQTCRKPGESFVFTIQADSHLDENCDPAIYQQTLEAQLADKPDFMIDLGDTFMTGKHPNRESALRQYQAQRYAFGLSGHSLPLFLVPGNHDGEEWPRTGRSPDGSQSLQVWSCLTRKRYFPNPEPDDFYSGNRVCHPEAGLLQDYFSWTWGDALFVVLDPYWTSRPNRGGKEPWNMTLGKSQYDWLAQTLQTSKATFKFVFIHQLVGGLDKAGRGGSEAALLYEWGGHEKDGTPTFSQNRPGWDQPIHPLLVKTGVSAVFHGHDHFFARQERDGLVYQLVPQPGHKGAGSAKEASAYGYQNGTILPGSGHLRVTVNAGGTKVEFVQPPHPNPQGKTTAGQIIHAYTIRK